MKTSILSERILAGMLGIALCGGSTLAAEGPGTGPTPAAGNCAVSRPVDVKATGTGPHQVVIEYNCSPGISTGTIYRPADLKGAMKFPILVWGEGGCSQNG